jgi:hypothetical protein
MDGFEFTERKPPTHETDTGDLPITLSPRVRRSYQEDE